MRKWGGDNKTFELTTSLSYIGLSILFFMLSLLGNLTFAMGVSCYNFMGRQGERKKAQ